MAAAEEGTLEVYVQPGESHLVRGRAVLRTVLGSCVGVTFRHVRLEIGALCHPMLPRYPQKNPGQLNLAASRRYVDFAIRDLAQQFDALGARRCEVEVKVFGGADVLTVQGHSSRPTVGQMNREMALEVLQEEGFDVAASRLGGPVGIHIDFYTETGEVRLRQLQSTQVIRHGAGRIRGRRHGESEDSRTDC